MEIVLKNISYTYQKVNYKDKQVLRNINMIFHSGTIYSIVGSSGSGKTTLLSIILGNLEPKVGTIQINGVDVKSQDKYLFNIGVVYQNPDDYFCTETVRQELEAQLKKYNYRLNEMNKRITDSLILVGLDNSFLNKKIKVLSFTEKKKLSLAIALISNPKFLILDEPSVNLDLESKKWLIQLLRRLKNRYKKTILIASNDTDFLLKIVDYVYVLGNQEIRLEGNKIDVFKQETILIKYHINVPKIIHFENLVFKRKGIRIGYRDDINDLMKDIYRNI